jgi:DNA-binding GntR family transcriptional regulator
MHLSTYPTGSFSRVTTPPALPWERLTDRSPLSLRVAARVAREIVERRHEPGDWLVEADLAAAEQVSRTPAREAMLLLESWGLVRLVPKKGSIVTPVSPAERRDLLDVRAMLEIAAVRTVHEGDALAALGEGLASALDRQRDALAADDLLAFASADYAFHAAIIAGGGNAVVLELLDTLGPRLARLTYVAVTDGPSRVAGFLDEHATLAALAAAGDGAAFEAAVREHIEAGHFGGAGR